MTARHPDWDDFTDQLKRLKAYSKKYGYTLEYIFSHEPSDLIKKKLRSMGITWRVVKAR